MIVVTGGTGLVGTHLLYNLCRSGNSLRVLHRKNSDILQIQKVFSYYTSEYASLIKQIEFVEFDIHDIYSLIAGLKGITEIYHCAAMVTFEGKLQNEMWKTNVEGTANMVNAAMECGIRKFLHVSSIAAIGKNKTNELCIENDFWKSSPYHSAYSESKYASEREVWRAAEEGLNIVIVNPSMIVGGGNWQQSSSNLFSKGYKGLKYYTDGSTGFIDVRDVAALMIALMNSTISNERYILSSENATYKRFFELVHHRFNNVKPNRKVGKFMSGIAWREEIIRSFITGSPPLITRETAQSAHKKNYYSTQKIKTLFPHYRFITLEQAVNDTCDLFLKDIKSFT